VSKKAGSESGVVESCEKCVDGMKSVQVKDPSKLAMAMNMKSLPGQMCRWFGSMRNLEFGSSLGSTGLASMWNSHHRVSMYSC